MSGHQAPVAGAEVVINFLGTLIIFGGAGALVYAVAQQGYAEIAASGLTVLIIQFVKLLAQNGVLTRPNKKTGKTYFQNIFGDLSGWAHDIREFKADRTIWQFAGLSLLYAIGFVVLRSAVMAGMGLFHNLIISIGVGMMIGGAIAAPEWYLRYKRPLEDAGVLHTDALRQPAPVAPAAVVPQPTSAPVVAQPAPSPEPAPASKKVVRVVRRTEIKEQNNV